MFITIYVPRPLSNHQLDCSIWGLISASHLICSQWKSWFTCLPPPAPTRLLTLVMYDFFLSLIPYTKVFSVLPAKYDLSKSINHVVLSCWKLFSGLPLHLAWNPRFIRPPRGSGSSCPFVLIKVLAIDTLTCSSIWHTVLLHLTHWPPPADTLTSTTSHTDLLRLTHWPPPPDTPTFLVISLALS